MLDMTGIYHIGRFFKFRSTMASDNSDKSDDETKKLRRLSNPTMRDKTTQTGADNEKVSRRRRVARVFVKPFRPIGRLLARIERFKPIHLIGLVLVPRYFRNSWRELRMVAWPSRRESRRLTSAVLVFAVIFGVLVAVVDFGLDKLFKKVILKQ